ncbi:MAG: BatD family protein [Bacteroidota bacterium]
MKNIKAILFISLLIVGHSSFGQLSLTATTDKNKVAVGEQFQITFECAGGGGNFTAPSFKDFNLLMGPNQGYQNINGRVSTTFTYILSPKATGKFTIGQGTLTSGGKSIQSNSITIEVVKSSANNQSGGKGGSGDDQVSQENLFIRISVSKNNVYLGEGILATYKVYAKVQLNGGGLTKAPAFNGFWSQKVDQNNHPVREREVLDGVPYDVYTVEKNILYPQRSGVLELESEEGEFNVLVQSRRRQQYNQNDPFAQFFNDPFFGGQQQIKVKRYSNSIKIIVKDLPEGAPASFKGAVGKFTMEAYLDKPETKANEPVSLKVKINGNGNLKLVDPLPLEFPQDIEAYDPKIADNTVVSAAGVNGNKTFEYLLIPRHSGDYKLPPIEFTYFDLEKKKYVTLNSPDFNLKVTKGSGPENVTINGVNKEDVQLLGKDIRYIKINEVKFHRKGDEFFGSFGFYSLFLSPIFLFIGFLVYYRKNQELQKNVTLLKSKKATKLARKRLSLAKDLLTKNNREQFYEEVSKATWGYLGDKLSIPLSALSKETISEVLQSRGINETLQGQFTELLNKCEFARFAPSNTSGQMQEVYDEAITLITKMEGELKA